MATPRILMTTDLTGERVTLKESVHTFSKQKATIVFVIFLNLCPSKERML